MCVRAYVRLLCVYVCVRVRLRVCAFVYVCTGTGDLTMTAWDWKSSVSRVLTSRKTAHECARPHGYMSRVSQVKSSASNSTFGRGSTLLQRHGAQGFAEVAHRGPLGRLGLVADD